MNSSVSCRALSSHWPEITVLIDAQLPKRLVDFIQARQVDAIHTYSLLNQNATPDHEIIRLADEQNRIVCSKVWLKPLMSILFSRKTTASEKLACVLAVLFISWFAWIFYLLLAPIKKNCYLVI